MRRFTRGLVVAFTALCSPIFLMAQTSLPTFFSDHMVLQRGGPVPIWGSDKPGQAVTILIDGKARATAVANDKGDWSASIPQFDGVGPYVVTVQGSTKLELKDVLVGEVWLCSGQSNMEWSVGVSNNPEKEIADAKNWPTLRLLQIPKLRSKDLQSDLSAKWKVCSPTTIEGFSAVAYSFGRKLSKDLDGVPIGLINTSWGGTHAEAWVPRAELIKLPGMLAVVGGDPNAIAKDWAEYAPKLKAFLERTGRGWSDESKIKEGWGKPEFDDSSWQTLEVPGMFQEQGLKFNATIWYRKTFEVTEQLLGELNGGEATLNLGSIDDFDQTFVNGQLVGTTDENTPSFWQAQRVYKLPKGSLKVGVNTIAVRVHDHGGSGGFGGPPSNIRIGTTSNKLPLAGDWKVKVEREVKPTSDEVRPVAPGSGDIMATELFNAMVHPLAPMSVRGTIWYQGESNSGNPQQYEQIMTTLIGSWRDAFNNPRMSFLVVQLANFMQDSGTPDFDSNWARLRESQRMLTLNVPDTAMAVAIDIGEKADIHPRNKQDVGTRLARQALAITYGKDVVRSGPTIKAVALKVDALVLTFDNVAKGVKLLDSDMPSGFAIGDDAGNWAWAKVSITAPDTLVLTASEITSPTKVRYAWGNSPACQLVNSENLPAVPFEAKASK